MSSSLAACGEVLMFGDTKEHETMQTGRSNHILTPYSPPPRDLSAYFCCLPFPTLSKINICRLSFLQSTKWNFT